MVENEWCQTDEYQWVKQLSEDVFHILDGTRYPHGSMTLIDVQVDVREFSQERLEYYVAGYYSNLTSLKKQYGEEWKQVVAEIIAEQQTAPPDYIFECIADMANKLNELYGIVANN